MKKLSLFLIGLFFIVLSGCSSSGGNGDYMPITEENMNEYFNGMADAKKSISVGEDAVISAIKQYKEPLEDMGYDFDATLLNTIKALQNAGYTNASTMATSFVNYTTYFIQNNPQRSVDGGFITEDTKNKILMYLKFKEMKPETIQALKFVKECQDEHNGICSIKQYVQILLDNSFVAPRNNFEYKTEFSNLSADNIFYKIDKVEEQKLARANMEASGDEENKKARAAYRKFEKKEKNNKSVSYHFVSSFEYKVKPIAFGKFLIHQDGKKVNGNFFMTEYTKPFKLKESATKELENYNPWWTK